MSFANDLGRHEEDVHHNGRRGGWGWGGSTSLLARPFFALLSAWFSAAFAGLAKGTFIRIGEVASFKIAI